MAPVSKYAAKRAKLLEAEPKSNRTESAIASQAMSTEAPNGEVATTSDAANQPPAPVAEAVAVVTKSKSAKPKRAPVYGPGLPHPHCFPWKASSNLTKLRPFGEPIALPTLDVEDAQLAVAIADALDEHVPETRLFIDRLLELVGADAMRSFYERTRKLEAGGGVRIRNAQKDPSNNLRRRTSGGVFFSLLEERLGHRLFVQTSVLAKLAAGLVPGRRVKPYAQYEHLMFEKTPPNADRDSE